MVDFLGKDGLSRNAIIAAVVVIAIGVAGATYYMTRGEVKQGPEEKPWKKIKWNSPKSWSERLKGFELGTIPDSWIEYQPALEKSINIYDSDEAAISGYTWPEGWQEAIEGVDELTFYNYGGMAHDPAIAMACAAFEDKTGIHVRAQGMEEIGLWMKTVSSMIAKKSSPQLIQINPYNLQQVVESGWVMNLDWFWPEEVSNLYSDIAKTSCTMPDGSWWGSGYCAFKPRVLFYRPSWLKEATGSSEPPSSFKELIEVSAKCADAKGSGYYGLALPGKDPRYLAGAMSMPLYSQPGGSYLDGEGNFDVTTEQYEKAFTNMVNLVKEGGLPTTAFGWSWTSAPETFARGKAAMLIASPTYASRWKGSPPPEIEGDWTFGSALPYKEGQDPHSTIVGCPAFWTINKYSSGKEKAAAALWLDLKRSYQMNWNELGFEGNESVITDLYKTESIKEKVPLYEKRIPAIKSTTALSLPVNGEQMLKYQLEWWQKAASGEVSVKEALSKLEEDIASIQ